MEKSKIESQVQLASSSESILNTLTNKLSQLNISNETFLSLGKYESEELNNKVILDASIWSNLPESIIEKIITRLPVLDVFQSRIICSKWNNILNDVEFLKACSEGPYVGPWFFIFTRGTYKKGITYDHTTNKWHHIPLFSHLPLYESLYPCATVGGLVCFISRFNASGTMTLVVCNPLTNSWRELPPMVEILPVYVVGILLEKEQGVYHVVVSGLRKFPITKTNHKESCRLCPTTELFTSTETMWKTTRGMPPGSYHSLAVPCNGKLYSWCYVSDSLVAYNIKSGCWTQIQACMPSFFEGHRLMECNGKLFMVGGLNKDNVTKGIYVLGFQWENLEWVKVDQMPKLLCEQFLRYGTDFRCIGYKDMVLLYVVRFQHIRLVVLYDLFKKLWRRLPPCSLMEDRLIHGIAFEPRLNAKA